MKRIILTIVFFALCAGAWAQPPQRVPARKNLIVREQPNGDELRTYLRGDERGHYSITEDGWEIRQTKKGWYKYAKRTRKGEIKTGYRKAHNAEKRSKCEIKWLSKYGVKKI